MVILSQDRTKLVNIDNANKIGFNHSYYNDKYQFCADFVDDFVVLGYYKTKKSAETVLEFIIEKIQQGKKLCVMPKDEELNNE